MAARFARFREVGEVVDIVNDDLAIAKSLRGEFARRGRAEAF
jgi:hypothetical protein